MEYGSGYGTDPLTRVRNKFSEHMAHCDECDFRPDAKNYGLCDTGFALHMQVRSLEHELRKDLLKDRNEARVGGLSGGKMADEGQGEPKKKLFGRKEEEVNYTLPFEKILKYWPLERMMPVNWSYVAHKITSNYHLLVNVKPLHQRTFGIRCILVDLALCPKHTDETRRDWLESTIALELMWEVI